MLKTPGWALLALVAVAVAPASAAAYGRTPKENQQLENHVEPQYQVVVNARGEVLVAFLRSSGRCAADSCGQLWTVFRPHGGAFGAPERVSPPGSLYELGDVSLDAAGDAYVAYGHLGTYDALEQAVRVRPFAGHFGPPERLGDHGFDVRLAVSPTGRAVAVWTRTIKHSRVAGFATFAVFGAVREPAGTFGPARRLSGDSFPVSSEVFPSPVVGIDAQGAAVAVWHREALRRYPSPNVPTVIETATSAPGLPFGRSKVISHHASSLSWGSPLIAENDRGDVVLVWNDPNGRLLTSYRPAGGSYSGTSEISPDDDSSAAALAIDQAGDVILLHRTGAYADLTGPNETVLSSERPANGTFGPAQTLMSGYEPSLLQLAMGGTDDSATAAWMIDGQVYCGKYSCDPVYTTSITATKPANAPFNAVSPTPKTSLPPLRLISNHHGGIVAATLQNGRLQLTGNNVGFGQDSVQIG